MLVLALDTSTPRVSLALGDDQHVLAELQLASGTDRGGGVSPPGRSSCWSTPPSEDGGGHEEKPPGGRREAFESAHLQ